MIRDANWLDETWQKLCTKMKAECARVGTNMPYIPRDGRYHDLDGYDISAWINGFWPGMLWQMYRATGDAAYRTAAEGVEARMRPILTDHFLSMDHDTGFLWLHTAVANYRLTENRQSFINGLHAANVLAGRFNPAGEFIRAWGSEKNTADRAGWMIIDCLMNLPLLYWASRETGDPRFAQVATRHTDTALRVLLRPDGSTHHIAALDPATGALAGYPDCQGYAPESAWSRGQAWAVYGMTLAYKYAGKPEYLDAAKRSANYFIANVAATGYVPLADFRAPATPVLYDTSAGACAACGLLELAALLGACEGAVYEDAAWQLLKALDAKHANWDPDVDSILAQGCVAYHSKTQTDVPLIYADYFFIEAVTRLKQNGFMIW